MNEMDIIQENILLFGQIYNMNDTYNLCQTMSEIWFKWYCQKYYEKMKKLWKCREH